MIRRRPRMNLTSWSRGRVRPPAPTDTPDPNGNPGPTSDLGDSLDRFARRAGDEARAARTAALDVGTGDDCYREHFDPARYQFIQLAPGPAPGELGRNHSGLVPEALPEPLPVDDEHVGLVLCTGGMEATAAPQYLLAEMNRVLEPEGHLYLAAPLIVPEQTDRNGSYRRYGQYGRCGPDGLRPPRYGLNYLLEASGFTIEDVQPMPATPARTYAVVARKARPPG